MKKLFYLLMCITVLGSCQKWREKKKITSLVQEWQGKEIVFPSDVVFTHYGTDTITYSTSDAEYIVLVYVDTMGCTSCKLQLHKWKELIAYTDSLTNKAVTYLFFFHPKNYKELKHLLRGNNFDKPVCVDLDDKLNKLNKFPANISFQTFLLDKNNRVVVLGNPVHNPLVKDLYLKQIAGAGNADNRYPLTEVAVEKIEVDLGTFKLGESQTAVFTLKNTGKVPLIILDVSTSCGCAAPLYDRHPAPPSMTLKVEVSMTPTEKGFFHKTATVRCNASGQQQVLRIKGQVI